MHATFKPCTPQPCTPPPPATHASLSKQNDTSFCKHCLPLTSFAGSNKGLKVQKRRTDFKRTKEHCDGMPWASWHLTEYKKASRGTNLCRSQLPSQQLIAVRKRSLWRLWFYTCLSFCPWGGGEDVGSPGPNPGGRLGDLPGGGAPGPYPGGRLGDLARGVSRPRIGGGVQAQGGVSQHAPRQTSPPPADSYCCGWYASYWNAFLISWLLNRMSCCWNISKYFCANILSLTERKRKYVSKITRSGQHLLIETPDLNFGTQLFHWQWWMK